MRTRDRERNIEEATEKFEERKKRRIERVSDK